MAESKHIANESFYDEWIAKELNGELSVEERKSLQEWVNLKAENRMLYNASVQAWNAAGKNDVSKFDTEQAWMKVSKKRALLSHEDTSIPLRSNSAWIKIAATILLLVGASWWLKIAFFNTPDAVELASGSEKVEMYLPDSSKVTLNKNSKLVYYTDYNEISRTVVLEGEAFFEVKKSPSKRFEVRTNRSLTTVLGTSFLVTAYKEDSMESVQVRTGKVSFASIHKKENEVLLLPGDKGKLDQFAVATKTEIKDPNFMAWKDEYLSFDNATLEEVARITEKYFSVKILAADPMLLTCRFTGTFNKPTLDEVMDVLTVSTNSSYRFAGNKIVLEGKGCNQ